MMFICESEMVKMWQFVFPEPEAVRSISSCTPSWVLTSRWPLPCRVVSGPQVDEEAELVACEIFG